MLHYCEYCEFNSKHKWVVKRHTEKKHKIYFNNITNNESKLIQEAIQINGAPNHQPLHNIQSGSGSVVTSSAHIPIEKYNEVVEETHKWKALYENSIPIEKYKEVVDETHKWKFENEKWGEAYKLLQEHRMEDGEHSLATITYLQNVLNANNIRYNLDLA